MRYILLFLKGVFMGTADLIPGVSGGTVALLVGIYEQLLGSIAAIASRANLRLLFRGRLIAYWTAIRGNFLFVLGLGILTAIFALAHLVRYCLEYYPIPVESFFFGLMLATVLAVGRKVRVWNLKTIVGVAGGVLAGLLLNFATPTGGSDTYVAYFVAGLLGICAMILPGISGSFILLLLGMYSRVLQLLVTVDILPLAIFAIGAVIGLLAFSHLLSWLLRHFERIVLSTLTGFILGAMVRLWPWKAMSSQLELLTPAQYTHEYGNAHMGYAVFFSIIGFAIVICLEWLTQHKSAKNVEPSDC